uniref:Uncharacterized protein n=1 Tax=Rhodnius prolixus TaxID=13249 RepID=T1I6C8_RHOPR
MRRHYRRDSVSQNKACLLVRLTGIEIFEESEKTTKNSTKIQRLDKSIA